MSTSHSRNRAGAADRRKGVCDSSDAAMRIRPEPATWPTSPQSLRRSMASMGPKSPRPCASSRSVGVQPSPTGSRRRLNSSAPNRRSGAQVGRIDSPATDQLRPGPVRQRALPRPSPGRGLTEASMGRPAAGLGAQSVAHSPYPQTERRRNRTYRAGEPAPTRFEGELGHQAPAAPRGPNARQSGVGLGSLRIRTSP